MAARPTIAVEVCHALPDAVFLRELEVEEGTTLQQAIERSGVLERFPALDLATCKVGIHGKVRPLDALLRPRDRIEIYRPLIADPKDARRRRAQKKAGKPA